MKSFFKLSLFVLLAAAMLLPTACNSNQTTVFPTTATDAGKQDQVEKDKQNSIMFLLGKDLKQPGIATSNTLYLTDGKGSVTINVGEEAFVAKLYNIDYQDDVEYAWTSDDPGIAKAEKARINGVAPGVTHVHCVTRAGDVVADLAVTVKESETWRIEKVVTLEGGEMYYNPLTMVGNYIYVGNSVGINKTRPGHFYFYKLDMDYNVIWKYDLGKLGVRGDAVLDSQGNIYFTAEDVGGEVPDDQANAIVMGKNIHIGIYFCSLTNSGGLRFSREITGKLGLGPDSMAYHIGMINCAIGKDDTIYIADSGLSAYDTQGNLKWQYGPDSGNAVTRSSPIFDNAGNLYVLMGHIVYRFDVGSQTPAWQTTVGTGWMDESPPSFNADYSRIIIPQYETVYSLDTSTGEKVWEFTPPGVKGEFRANAVVDAQGNIYIGTKADRDSTLYAIKADGAGLLWQLLVGGDLYCSPVLGDDGLLYLGSEPSVIGAFYAIKPATGDLVWTLSEGSGSDKPGFGGIGWASLRIQDGYVYGGGCKIKIDAKNYFPGAGWPTLRGSNDDSGYRQ